MVTYILGNSIKKRAQFSKINNEEELYIDDMHIACDIVSKGIYYYAVEGRLFKNMRACDFVAYSRSLFDAQATNIKHLKRIMKAVGYNGLISKKLSKVSDIDYLKILVASKIKDTTRAIYFNLDEWKYTAKNAERMKKLFSGLSELSVFALVSDIRFSSGGNDVLYLTSAHDLVLLDGEFRRIKTSKRRVLSMLKCENSIT